MAQRNARYSITQTQINKFNKKLTKLNLTKKAFCEQHDISYNTLNKNLSQLKLPQSIYPVIMDFIDTGDINDIPQPLPTPQTTERDKLLEIVQKTSSDLYKRVTNPNNIFLALSHKDNLLLSNISNKILQDLKAINKIVTVVGLENIETGEYIVLLITGKKDKGELIEVVSKYVGDVEE